MLGMKAEFAAVIKALSEAGYTVKWTTLTAHVALPGNHSLPGNYSLLGDEIYNDVYILQGVATPA